MSELAIREFGGLPIRYDEKCPWLAHACGFWPLKSIVIGPSWFSLSGPEQQAVLAHEAGHCEHLHLELRLLLAPFFWCAWAQKIARRHEFEADAFAVRAGQGAGMLQIMLRAFSAENLRAQKRAPLTADEIIERKLSPSAADRLRNISHLLQEIHP